MTGMELKDLVNLEKEGKRGRGEEGKRRWGDESQRVGESETVRL